METSSFSRVCSLTQSVPGGAPSPSMPAAVQCSIATVSLQLLQYYRSPDRGSGQVSWQTNHSSIILSKPSGRSCTAAEKGNQHLHDEHEVL